MSRSPLAPAFSARRPGWVIPVIGTTSSPRGDNGGTAHEQITAHERPGYFAYRLWSFGFYMRYFVREARGQWWFEQLPGGATRVCWTYIFDPLNPLPHVAAVEDLRRPGPPGVREGDGADEGAG